MPSNHNRIDRISEEVMRRLSELLPTIKDPRIQGPMLSILRCDVAGDLSVCKVYLSALGSYDQKELMRGLRSASGYLRRELAHTLTLRYTPELTFILDDSISHGVHISRLISELETQETRGEDDASE